MRQAGTPLRWEGFTVQYDIDPNRLGADRCGETVDSRSARNVPAGMFDAARGAR
jgi:hypothetical protein